MRVTVRHKLILLVGCAVLSLAGATLGEHLIGTEQRAELNRIEAELVPRFELAPQLRESFTRLARGFQDAVEAEDPGAISSLERKRTALFELIASREQALDAERSMALRWAIEHYFESARRVSLRLIRGEAGADVVEEAAEMQARQQRVEKLIAEATFVDRSDLAASFAAARKSSTEASRLVQIVALLGVGLVLALGYWVSSHMLRNISVLSTGLARFATGSFDSSIRRLSDDEFGDIIRDANAMAKSLGSLEREREASAWRKAGEARISQELRGNLEPKEIAEKALSTLVSLLSAVAGAVYLRDPDGDLTLAASYARSVTLAQDPGLPPRFAIGAGLVGEAARRGAIWLVDAPPNEELPLRSAFAEGRPRQLVLVPLSRSREPLAVLELALLGPLPPRDKELLESLQEVLAVTIAAAQDRTAVAQLLQASREQAQQLAQQEEELRATNQELGAQQEELRATNEELEEQREELRTRNEELVSARQSVQQQVEKLEQISRYKSQFLANMSHELRTPLNSMLLLSQLLSDNRDQNLTQQQVEYCKTIHSAGVDLLDLINQILDLSKIEAGKQTAQRDEVRVRDIVDSMWRIFLPLARERGLELEAPLSEDAPERLVTDRLRVERILSNLLGNALKFTQRGRVTLRVTRPGRDSLPGELQNIEGDVVAFSVDDTGIGIAPGDLRKVFEPFEQIDSTTSRKYQGTGLGLAIARESAQLLGGVLTATSSLGHGSTFTLFLPLGLGARTETEERHSAPAKPSPRPPPPHHPGSSSILVVEDDVILADQLADIIGERGLFPIVVHTGEDGLEVALREKPLGIILDVKLPDLDGWTLMERLSSMEETQDIPVHFLSGIDAPESGLARGAIGYLTKPATREELVEVVGILAPRTAARSERILIIEDSLREAESLLGVLRAEGFDVEHVTTAKDAQSKLERGAFGCIILDLGLPDVDGLGFLETLRAREDFSGTRVVVHTGRSLTKQESQRLEAYAEAIVMKDGDSATRLIDELRLFLHHVGERRPRASLPVPEPPHHSTNLEGARVLVVEDDMRTVYSLSALLESRGCHVFVAENGREAIELLNSNQAVDCVLMDIMMPEMDGYEAMRHLRSDQRFADLPIIALTAKAMSTERERCLSHGASDYVSKPVNASVLLSSIHSCMAQVQASVGGGV